MIKKTGFKKMLSFIVAAMLMVTFAACGQKAPDKAEAPAADTKKEEAPKAEAPEAQTEEAWKPTRPVTIVCFVGAGGGTDLASRTIAKVFEKEFGVPFQVVNMTGGSGGVGANHVLNAKRDGYTILGASEPLHGLTVLGALDKPTADIWEAMMMIGSEGAISVPASSPYQTLEELVEAAKTKELKAAAAQATSTWGAKLHQVEAVTGVKFNQLPYEGSHPSQVAALSGEVDVVVTSLAEQAEYIKAKKLRPLAAISTEDEEVPGYGKVPAITHSYPKYAELTPAMQWLGIAIPKDLPENIKKAYHDAFEKAKDSEEVKKVASDLGYKIYGLHGEAVEKTHKQLDSIYSWTLYNAGAATKSPEEFDIPKP
ncbi:tripartite tricarboxylate transporter substrate binding protein [Petroclostridium sp. X23]|uniref:tripartite tricarboxylate transporter substrate binding protein n=1 Tax=Petroclostridium sp. X23 TaxID=3045146 RepID=UPI0024AE7D39|nr:tripartite tricarboxylate transporter substrate binding protein [Petroclostridium sp. X23]WHH61495.1 tripartite tricarboxylate transporter substrate binding protein [Petroclostridium sp. X23]